MADPALTRLASQLSSRQFVEELLRPPAGLGRVAIDVGDGITDLTEVGVSVDAATVARVLAARPAHLPDEPAAVKQILLTALRAIDERLDELDHTLPHPWLPLTTSTTEHHTFGPSLSPRQWSRQAKVLAVACLLSLSMGAGAAADEHISDFIQTTAAVLALVLAAENKQHGPRQPPTDEEPDEH